MLRTTLFAVFIAALSFAFAAPALPAAPAPHVTEQCAASQAQESSGNWDILCGGELSCGSGTFCMRALSRDAEGDFYVCRCDGGEISKCCQLILRVSTQRPEARGSCSDCGQTGDCVMTGGTKQFKADCRFYGSERL